MKKITSVSKKLLLTGGVIALIGIVSISAVACFNSPAKQPLNNSATQYKQISSLTSTGFFSIHTGNYLRALQYNQFLIELANTYKSLNLNLQTAKITNITYNFALNDNNGQLEVWIRSPYNNENNGIYFYINQIKNQLALPLPPPPAITTINVGLSQLFPNSILSPQKITTITAPQWTIALKAQGLIGNSYSVNQIKITSNNAYIYAKGLSNNQQTYTIEFIVSLPWAVHNTAINKTTTVQSLFNKSMSLTQFYTLSSAQILQALNSLLSSENQILSSNVINNNGSFKANVNMKTLNNLFNNTSSVVITINTNNITYTFTIQGFLTNEN